MLNIDYKFWRDFDWSLALIPVALVAMGTVFIYSSQPDQVFWKKQLIWLGVSTVALLVFAFTDYRKWLRLAPFFYAFMILMLGAVLVFGSVINGAKAWINFGPFSFQPAELSKLATILMLARYLSRPRRGPLSIREIAVAGAIVALPCGLILLQPD